MGALKPNSQITPDLLLLRRLGGGGMGTVWVAHHQRLGVEVVVKFLSEQLAANEEACERFSREVRATLRVRSPHVVQMLDHGFTERGIPFIVMELLEGQDLARTLRDQGSLRPDEVQHVVDGLAAALSKAHERGIVHRDIKPANVFMCSASPRPFIKLVDFGISKRLEDDSMTANHAVLGTPAYMSPEQVRAEGDIDHRADLWALGVLAYHMLAGEPPFRGGHVANIAHAILKGPRPKITTSRTELPVAVDAWLERALAVEPDHRFQSAQEMAESLAQALGDLAYAGSRSTSSGLNRSSASPSGPTRTGPSVGPATEPLLRVAPDVSRPPPMTAHTPGGGFQPSGFVTPPPMPPPPRAPSMDSFGASFGPSVLSQPPYEPASRLKWWVMGTTAAFVVLIGVAFRVGYGLRNKTVPPAAAAVSTDSPPPPVPVTITSPPAAPPTSAESVASSVSAAVSVTVAPPTSASGSAKPASSAKKPRFGR